MQRKKKTSNILKVSLHGMNDRMQKMMINYLDLCCKGMAQVVEESKSDVEIIDIDTVDSKPLLERRLVQHPVKPIIVLSLQEVSYDGVVYVKKPIDIDSVVNALITVEKILLKKKAVSKNIAINNANSDASLYEGGAIVEKSSDNGNKESLSDSSASSAFTPKVSKKKITTLKKDDSGSSVKSLGVEKNEKPVSPSSRRQQKSSVVRKRTLGVRSTQEPAKFKVTAIPKETPDDSSSDAALKSQSERPSKKNVPSKIKKTGKSKVDSERMPIRAKRSSIQIEEIDELLKELHNSSKKLQSDEDSSPSSKEDNKRKTIRYAFYPIEAKLKKNSLTSLKNSLTVMVVDVSSKGARIEFKKPTKLRGKVTLKIQLDSKHVFIIPARVVRKEDKIIYGLQFLDSQHELTDFLVGSGRSFFFT